MVIRLSFTNVFFAVALIASISFLDGVESVIFPFLQASRMDFSSLSYFE